MVKTLEPRRSMGGVTKSSRIGKAEKKQVPKKSLNSEFDSVAEEESRDVRSVSEVCDGVYCADDNLDLSPVSEVSDGDFCADFIHQNVVVDTPASASSNAFSLVELTPAPKITPDIHGDLEHMIGNYIQCGDSAYSKVNSVEVDVVVKHLKYALPLIQSSSGVDNPSKKLVDTLIKTVIDEFYGIPEESDMLSKIVLAKTRIVATCLLLWMICTLVAVYVKCHTNIPFYGPLPT